MTDMTTNRNMEDVLSSVRRLVSDTRPGRESDQSVIVQEERLVLTDDFRIVENSVESSAAPSPSPTRSEVILEGESVAAAAPEPAAPPQPEPEKKQRAEPGEDIENDVIIADGFLLDSSVDVADPDDARAMATLEETIAGLEFVISQDGISFDTTAAPAEEPKAEAPEVAAAEPDPASAVPAAEPDIPLVPAPVEETASEAPPADAPLGIIARFEEDDENGATVVESPITATDTTSRAGNAETEWDGWVAPEPEFASVSRVLNEPKVEITEDEGAEEEPSQAEVSVSTEASEPTTEDSAPSIETVEEPAVADAPIGAAESADEPEPTEEETDAASDDLAGLESEVTRELVAALVREELQGELGERITRSVRKLVRREVQRILAAQELQ